MRPAGSTPNPDIPAFRGLRKTLPDASRPKLLTRYKDPKGMTMNDSCQLL
jgi:hypothetical protein